MSILDKKISKAQNVAKSVVQNYLKNQDRNEVLNLWKYLAFSKLVDYRQPKSIARQIQVQVFEAGILPFSDLEYHTCQEISKEMFSSSS
jgi:hypothetical protein